MTLLGNLLSKPFSMGDLMGVDAKRQEKAASCNVTLQEVIHEPQVEPMISKLKRFFTGNHQTINIYYVTFKFKVTSETGHDHTVIVRCSPDPYGVFGMSNKVQVFCTCRDFCYRSAYTLQRHGSLFRSQATDLRLGSAITEAPKAKSVTSPLCKHAFAVLNYFSQNYNSLMTA